MLNTPTFDENSLATADEIKDLVALLGNRAARRPVVRDFKTSCSPLAPTSVANPAAAPPSGVAVVLRDASTGITADSRSVSKPGRRVSFKAQTGCRCGSCKRCLDNARWNRIYSEKFADPEYYGSITLKHNSALAEES